MRWIFAYVGAGAAMLALDALWLRWAGPNLYRPAIGELLAPQFRAAPAAIFYLAYVAAVVWFAIRPGGNLGAVAINGALLGGIAYATYDLTNQATMKVWSTHVTAIDIGWGAFLTAVAAVAGSALAARFG